jgi:hypothetical protein
MHGQTWSSLPVVILDKDSRVDIDSRAFQKQLHDFQLPTFGSQPGAKQFPSPT